MNYKKLAAVMVTAVGEINQVKIEKLRGLFADRFPLIGRQEGGPSVVFINPNGGSSIIITPDRIIVEHNGENVTVGAEEITQISDDLKTVSSVLLLDESFQFAVDLVAHVRNIDSDAMAASLNAICPEGGWDGLDGVGLRLIFQREGIWEFKLEPYLADGSFYFLEAICNTPRASINTIEQLMEDSVRFLVDQSNVASRKGYLK